VLSGYLPVWRHRFRDGTIGEGRDTVMRVLIAPSGFRESLDAEELVAPLQAQPCALVWAVSERRAEPSADLSHPDRPALLIPS
jgi:hypothetical protein